MKKEQETKKDYESPLTKETQVEMEGNLCGSITTTGRDKDGVNIKAQKINNSSANTGFADEPWGEITNTTTE